MRSIGKLIVFIAAGLVALSGVAIAEENVEVQLQQLNDRMTQLEDDLDSANAKVAAQEEIILDAELDEARPGRNALSAYLEATEISAWVAASYNINFRNPDKTAGGSQGSTNQGAFGGTYNLFYPESNTVQLDQAWIGINKAPTDESRGGYNLDLVAGSANNGASAGVDSAGGGTNTPYALGVYAASASYMMPLMDGFTIEGGLIPTWQGAEVAQQTQNLNVTRGIQWNTQPVTNLGFTGALDMGGFTFMVGMLNNSLGLDGPQDTNNNKAVTSRVNYGADKFSIGAGVNYGKNETVTGAGKHMLLNVLASVDPTDNLTAYIDYTYNHTKGGGTSKVHAISLATRLEVIDTTGIALRGEYLKDSGGILLNDGTGGGNGWSVTGTIDHALTDNLKTNVEIRYDGADTASGGGFWNSSGTGTTEDGQVLGLIQLVYEF